MKSRRDDANAPAPAPAPTDDAPFEVSMKRLAEIVGRLERGDLPLEESLALFEEGVSVSARSQAKLEAAQRRVEELLAVDDEGRSRRAPLDPLVD
ncbi:MAG: exodeoxyribonuclease VII small subunit [Myxococcales bacterium]|jgi:exodeoxyribonuclease VII small subunit|nr:exodeoxyribonuclease VII small subunit [Myxococcales bacterium]MBL0198398.1 exodeoxyribonuclease VII small subunit [Myxococcales bacterium]HQY61751.1 exodeoxyribonuclease VII small subunit [Polyangiaceae bacterium]